jgi:hypothetical protein
MNIDALKETLGDEKFSELSAYIKDLTGQRDTARNESIQGRKKLKEDLAAAQALAAKALDKLGVESAEEIDALPDAKGQGEALKQFETQLKRVQREKDEALKLAQDADSKYRGTLQRAAISEALAGHEFIARDVVETFISHRLQWDGDELLFKDADGKLVGVKDGVSGIAKTRPELLKPTGTGGAGVRSGSAGSAPQKSMPVSQFDALPPTEQAKVMAQGYTLTD